MIFDTLGFQKMAWNWRRFRSDCSSYRLVYQVYYVEQQLVEKASELIDQ